MEKSIEKYKVELEELEYFYKLIFNISNSISGKQVESLREEHGSFILVKFGLTLGSIIKLLPDSFLSDNEIKIWDISSVSILARSLYETYLIYYYLCIEEIPADIRKLRELIWEYHAGKEREKMLKTIESRNPELSKIETENTRILDNLNKNSIFKVLDKNLQERVCRGEKYRLSSNKEIAENTGIKAEYFSAIYKFFSCYVHTSCFSIQQLIESTRDKSGYIQLFITTVKYCQVCSLFIIRDTLKLFPESKLLIPENIIEEIRSWEEYLKTFPQHKRGIDE